MATVNEIRNALINKILTIGNKDFLMALDKLISSTSMENDLVELTPQ